MKKYMDSRFAAVDGTIVAYDGRDKTLIIPAALGDMKITTIGLRAFSNPYLEVVYIPRTVKLLRREAFSGCRDLHTVYLPSSVETDRNPFEGDDKLSLIHFDEITLSKEEADILSASSTDVGDGYFMTHVIPTHPLFNGIKEFAPICTQQGLVPDGAGLFYMENSQVYEPEPCFFDNGADNSELTNLGRLIASGAETYLDTATEEKNDEAQRNNERPKLERTAFMFYRRGDSPQKIRGFIRIGLYFWQSLIPVTLQGGRYTIYRRCYVTKSTKYQYCTIVNGVFDSEGRNVDKQIEEQVYGKYALVSIL